MYASYRSSRVSCGYPVANITSAAKYCANVLYFDDCFYAATETEALLTAVRGYKRAKSQPTLAGTLLLDDDEFIYQNGFCDDSNLWGSSLLVRISVLRTAWDVVRLYCGLPSAC